MMPSLEQLIVLKELIGGDRIDLRENDIYVPALQTLMLY